MGLEGFGFNRRRFRDLSEQEVLALAISSEEDDARIYRSYAERLRADYPDSAAMFDEMAAEEDTHRQRLIELHRARFGEVIPLIRREHVAGYYARRPVWLVENLGLDRIRDEAAAMEQDAEAFYLKAAQRSTGRRHPQASGRSCPGRGRPPRQRRPKPPRRIWADARESEDDRAHRQFVLTWVQPGLAGLMDGSVSTLAPDLRHRLCHAGHLDDIPRRARRLGRGGHLDGLHRGRLGRWRVVGPRLAGQARLRLGHHDDAGRLGHALPYLIPDFWTATITAIAWSSSSSGPSSGSRTASWRRRFCARDFQVVLGGALVFAAGALIGGG
jgi:hypothetical protein